MRILVSAPDGGCGHSGCRCSPEWWIAADLEDRTVAITFQHQKDWRGCLDRLRREGFNV